MICSLLVRFAVQYIYLIWSNARLASAAEAVYRKRVSVLCTAQVHVDLSIYLVVIQIHKWVRNCNVSIEFTVYRDCIIARGGTVYTAIKGGIPKKAK